MSAVTLEGCIFSSSTGGFAQRRQEWHVSEAVFGLHVNPECPWKFFGARFSMPLLTRWVSWATTEVFHEVDEVGMPKRLGAAISIESWPLWRTGRGDVTLARAGSTKNLSETVTAIESRIDVRIRSSAELTRDEFDALAVRPLQVLLGLATGKFTAAISGGAYTAPPDCPEGKRSFDWIWHPHEVTSDHRKVQYGFTYSDLAALGIDALESWVQRLPAIEPVINLYIASLRHLGYSELSFLLIAQALETFHRRESNETIINNELWKVLDDRLRSDIKNVVGDVKGGAEMKARLIGKLSHLNELGLRTRLKHLFALLRELGPHVCGCDPAQFVDKIVNTRNYYTHWSADLELMALRGADLLYATSRLMAALELLLLRGLGLGSESKAAKDILHRRISWLPAG